MLGPGALLFAAAGVAGPPAGSPVITHVEHSVTIGASCPSSPNFHVTYTATGTGPDRTVRISRTVNDGSPEVVYTGPLQASETVDLPWGRKSGADTETIRAKVEALLSGVPTSSQEDANSNHSTDSSAVCPE